MLSPEVIGYQTYIPVQGVGRLPVCREAPEVSKTTQGIEIALAFSL